MGSCASIHRSSDSAVKIPLQLGSKTKGIFAPSPTKKTSMNGENPVPEVGSEKKKLGDQLALSMSPPPIGAGSGHLGSKEEAFFDTQAWLDSDCDDDFLSVNGEFTPSGSSTPNYQRSVPGTPKLNRAFFAERLPNGKLEPSPTNKKKKLGDLFKESFRDEHDTNDQVTDIGNPEINNSLLNTPLKSSHGTPRRSGIISIYSSETTPSKDFREVREKKVKGTQCCLPSLVTSLSFTEKKKHPSPPHENGG